LAPSFLEKYLLIAARNRAVVVPDCTYYIINLYTAVWAKKYRERTHKHR